MARSLVFVWLHVYRNLHGRVRPHLPPVCQFHLQQPESGRYWPPGKWRPPFKLQHDYQSIYSFVIRKVLSLGLDFSYILYFQQEKWYEALQKVISIADPVSNPTRLIFPDHEILVPFETWVHNTGVVYADKPELEFTTALFFEEDEEIRDYRRYRSREGEDRCPPLEDKPPKVSIGYIYLSIQNNLIHREHQNDLDHLCRFNFGTPGSSMSTLFDFSPSIRKAFVELLESVPGVCGVFNREDSGVVFWWQGERLDDIKIEDAFLPPVEIDKFIKAENNRE